MNTTSRPTSVLLDKSVVREALRAIQRLLNGQPLPERQRLCYLAIVALIDARVPTYITEQIVHIVSQRRISLVAQVLLPHLRVFKRGRYLARWARRLREEGLSREDAVIVSHASFGVDVDRTTFGARVVLTTDYALQSRCERSGTRIRERFTRMTGRLKPPYREASLPIILTPEEVIERLAG